MARRFTFLGTGTSVGIPMLGCSCDVCQSTNPKNNRYRCSVLITTPAGRILIDTPPELRLQLLREKVPFVHAVLFTHYHADHLFGLDDVRPFPKHLGGPLPLFCNAETEEKIRQSFAYAFQDGVQDPTRPEASLKVSGVHPAQDPRGSKTHLWAWVPQLTFARIEGEAFRVLDQTVVPIALEHSHYHVLGFRVGDVAYCTDVNRIPEASWPKLEGLRVLVLDALRPKPHPAHFSLDEALEVIARLRPEQAYLTHIAHELEHEATNRRLPPGVEVAYDGLQFEF